MRTARESLPGVGRSAALAPAVAREPEPEPDLIGPPSMVEPDVGAIDAEPAPAPAPPPDGRTEEAWSMDDRSSALSHLAIRISESDTLLPGRADPLPDPRLPAHTASPSATSPTPSVPSAAAEAVEDPAVPAARAREHDLPSRRAGLTARAFADIVPPPVRPDTPAPGPDAAVAERPRLRRLLRVGGFPIRSEVVAPAEPVTGTADIDDETGSNALDELVPPAPDAPTSEANDGRSDVSEADDRPPVAGEVDVDPLTEAADLDTDPLTEAMEAEDGSPYPGREQTVPVAPSLASAQPAEPELDPEDPAHSALVAEAAESLRDDALPWAHRPARTGRSGRIGALMIERGLITQAQLDEALEVQRATGQRVGDLLVELGVVSRFDLARVLADHAGVPFVDLRAKPPDPILAALLPEDVARRYHALVIARWNDQLVVAMEDPSDLFVLDDLQMVIGQPMIAAMAVGEDLAAAIDRVYRVSDIASTLGVATSDYVPDGVETAAHAAAVEVDEGPVVRLVNALMEQAIGDHASDLHVEPSSTGVAIRFRIDGVLHDSSEVPLSLLRPLVSRLKILANLDIAHNRIAQDGRFSVSVQGRPVDVRVVTVPTAAGESVILRLLDPTHGSLDLASLGLTDTEAARFLPPLRASQGAAFLTGPTGSGKTTTVYAVLSEINTRSKSIVSVEDPVEYRLDGIKQIQVNPRVGLTFANTLPSILRSDPDVVFIGEVRDTQTARIAADASITGHLVLSTLHATRAAAAPMRLIEMGVEPYLVASALTLVAAQRLARKLCAHCAQPVDASDIAQLRGLGADDGILDGATILRAVGCPACRNTGYRGRVPIFEIMPVTEGISRLILDRAPRTEIERLAVEEGMETMRTAALRRVADGTLTTDEMMRIVS